MFYQSLQEDDIVMPIGAFELACHRLGMTVELYQHTVVVEPTFFHDNNKLRRIYPRAHFKIPEGWSPRWERPVR